MNFSHHGLFFLLLPHKRVFAISEDRRKEGYRVTQSPKELSRTINRYKIFWKEQLKVWSWRFAWNVRLISLRKGSPVKWVVLIILLGVVLVVIVVIICTANLPVDEKNVRENLWRAKRSILRRNPPKRIQFRKKSALTNLRNYLLGWKKSGNSKSILFSLILSVGIFCLLNFGRNLFLLMCLVWTSQTLFTFFANSPPKSL